MFAYRVYHNGNLIAKCKWYGDAKCISLRKGGNDGDCIITKGFVFGFLFPKVVGEF